MKLNQINEYLQTRSDRTKNRIILFVVILAALGFGYLWINSLSGNFGDLSADSIIPKGDSGAEVSTQKFISLEAKENKDGKTYIYFKIENPTDDILNFSATDDIFIRTESRDIEAEKITNRQNQEFVRKVLSKTTNYGVITFPQLTPAESIIIFDIMFLEQNPNNIFKEELEFNIENLDEVGELRS